MKNFLFLLLINLFAQSHPVQSQTIPEAVGGFRWPVSQNYGGTGSCSGNNFCNNGGYQFNQNTNFAYGQSCGNIYHPGQDWNVPGGGGGCSTGCSADECVPVYAAATGKVVYMNGSSWGGVVIQHNYQGQTWYSQYGHVRDILVSNGQIVTKGQQIAKIGKVGADCAHLHFEIRESDHPNPTYGAFFCSAGLSSSANVENWYDDPATFIPAKVAYAPALIAPANNASISSGNIGFDWADIAGAINYRIQITTNPSGFTQANGFTTGMIVNATTGTVSSYTANLAPGTYYWTERGATNFETSLYAQYRTLVVTGGSAPVNDNCSGAITLSVGSTCIQTSGSNVGATASTPAPTANCPNSGYKDVWYKFVVPNISNPQVTVRLTAGNLLDGVAEVYVGSCSSLTYVTCEDDNNNGSGSTMPVINLSGGAGQTVWVRVWGYGGATGSFAICVLNYYSSNITGTGVNDPNTLQIIPNDRNMEGDQPERIPTKSILMVSPNPANSEVQITSSNIEPCSEMLINVVDASGRVVLQQSLNKDADAPISERLNISDLDAGIYWVMVQTCTRFLNSKLVIIK